MAGKSSFHSWFEEESKRPPDAGDKEKASIEDKVSTSVASAKQLPIVAQVAESADLPAEFQFAWSDGRTCGIERLGEYYDTEVNKKTIAKRPRDWISCNS